MEDSPDEHGIPYWAADGKGGVLFADIPTRPGGRLPQFVVIGSPKTATTSLARYLDEHPKVHLCPMKEPHFFSTDAIYERGTDWYEGLFADAEDGQICGEASTSYTRYPYSGDVAGRMHALIPDAKLIYLVREPVARTISACEFWHRRETQFFQRDVPNRLEVVLEMSQMPLRTSEYIVQIEQFMKFYDRSQLLVLLQEDLAADSDAVVRQVFEFIGVDPDVKVDTATRHNTTAGYYDWAKNTKASELLNKIPGAQALKKLVPPSARRTVREFLAGRVSNEDVVEPFSEAKKAELREHFAPFNRRLEEFLGRELHQWR